jgi:hypothetical protein
MHQLDDELHRRFIVVVKDDLEVTGLGLNIAHEEIPPNQLSFRKTALGCGNRLEQSRNNVTSPRPIIGTRFIALLL